MFGECTKIDRPLHLIMKYQPCGKRSQGRPLEIPLDRFMRPEQVTKHKTCQLYDYDDDDDDDVDDDDDDDDGS